MGVSISNPEAAFSWRSFFAHLGSFLMLCAVVGLLVALAVGMRPIEKAMESGASEPPNVLISWPRVKLAKGQPAVTWVPEAQREALLAAARQSLQGSGSSLSADPLEQLGKAMQQSGWFHGTPVIRRDMNNTVVIDGRWRVPAALVRREGRDQLISWEGLPMPLSGDAGRSRFPIIENPALPVPRTADGSVDMMTAWPGEDIAASLELLQVLLRQPWGSQVAGIDASAYSSDKSLVIVTPFQTRVVWGGRVSRPSLGEVTSERKLAHLTELYEKHRRIDAGFPLIYVNNSKLQFDISATARALAGAGGEPGQTPSRSVR